ncbi:glycosyltransferase [Chroococcus sp. FPU101]|uniref:glycosyltransferase n=1 Tax=Chroococcus sp. FPU101 TaxID=1974212 RepID=UPI001A8C0C84|nr:nucleotide disphospho-sugar-binding domain-containing protein [Chroococcus sp. FPU101]GFE68085.1 putative glycosyl transferase [Chroococcus sp. FPU101]
MMVWELKNSFAKIIFNLNRTLTLVMAQGKPMKSKIVINTIGSLGDLYPYLAIAIELKQRGYHPVLAASESLREFIESENIKFEPVRPNPEKYFSRTELVERTFRPDGIIFLFSEVLLPYLKDSYDDLEEICQDARLLISHPIAFAAPFVAQKKQIPWISTVLAPSSFFSADDLPIFNPILNFQGFPLWFKRLFIQFAKFSLYLTSHPIQKLRKELGLPPAKDPFFDDQYSPDLILGLFSSLLAPPQPDWPAQARLTGFSYFEPIDSKLPDELRDFLNSGTAPLIFTLGSSAVEVGKTFYTESAMAAKKLGERAVLLTGRNLGNKPSDLLDDTIIAVDYAPHFLLFPLGKAIVHQGGIGTTAQALKAGKPMIIVPFGADQFDNAARVERLGVGKTLFLRNYQTQEIVLTLTEILNNHQLFRQASTLGEQIQQENGVAQSCVEIEKFLSGH